MNRRAIELPAIRVLNHKNGSRFHFLSDPSEGCRMPRLTETFGPGGKGIAVKALPSVKAQDDRTLSCFLFTPRGYSIKAWNPKEKDCLFQL